MSVLSLSPWYRHLKVPLHDVSCLALLTFGVRRHSLSKLCNRRRVVHTHLGYGGYFIIKTRFESSSHSNTPRSEPRTTRWTWVRYLLAFALVQPLKTLSCSDYVADVRQFVKRSTELKAGEQGASTMTADISSRPLSIVKEVLVLDCKHPDGDIDNLRSSIEKIAYSSDYSFPSVQSKLPTPYLYAFSCLEAVRRGVDLSGDCTNFGTLGDNLKHESPEKARAFIRFPEARTAFQGLWKATKPSFFSKKGLAFDSDEQQLLGESEDVFLRAIKLHEAQGAILLTDVDGGQGNNAQIVIHVDPVQFVNMIRRIVDIRLVEPEKWKGNGEALDKAFPKISPHDLFELSKQQERFFEAGEVSKDYLNYLWCQRDLRVGPSSRDSRCLDMTDDDVDAMVDSLLEVRMMFRVRDGPDRFVKDRYVVPCCLPDYVDCSSLDPEAILELDVGSVMWSRELKVSGNRRMPPGLVPRLVAWCGQGEGRITACWRHGVCFAYKDHPVLVYEVLEGGQTSSIVCCVKGDANTEKAGRIREEIADEVVNLVADKKYGFPGLRLLSIEKKRVAVSTEKRLKEMFQELKEALEDHMNVRFDELEKQSERIAGDWPVYIPIHCPFVTFCCLLHARGR